MTVTSQPMTSTQEERTVPTVKIGGLIPAWSQRAAKTLIPMGGGWRVTGAVVALLIMGVGIIGLLGGGYTSIQGVRIPLSIILPHFGFSVRASGWPPLWWWLFPLATNLIQIFCRVVPPLRVLWRPTVMYDSVTTGVFGALTLVILGSTLGYEYTYLSRSIYAILAAFGALLTTVVSEQLFLGGFRLLWGCLRRK